MPPPDLMIRTPRLRLRPLAPNDLDLLVALDADPEVRRYVDQPQAPTVEVYRQRLPRMLTRYGAHREPAYWVGEDVFSKTFYGWFHLRPVDDDLSTWDLGFRLRRQVWGRGFATEGAAALVERAFRQLRAVRVVAHVLEGHAASRRVLEKVGLRVEKHYLHRGELPAVAYILKRADYVPPARE